MTQTSREFQVFAKPAGALCNLRCEYCYYLEREQQDRVIDDKVQGAECSKPGSGLHPAIMSDSLLQRYITEHIKASDRPVINFSWHGGEPTLAGIDFFRRVVELQNRYKPAERRIINGLQTNGTLLDDEWCSFLAGEKFVVGISIDGPEEFHDLFRRGRNGKPTFRKVIEVFRRIQDHGIIAEILCVVHSGNAVNPLGVYRFFRQLGARYLTFLPLVEKHPSKPGKATRESVSPDAFGNFMSEIFDEWVANDIGKIRVQLFEEAARTAFNQDHTLCIFKKTCGGVPVVEKNGDFYSCDHFADKEHLLGNINDTSLAELLDSKRQKDFGRAKLDTLPRYCLECEVRSMCNGECPKNRFILTPGGEQGLNYLCAGYRKFFNHCKPWVEAVGQAWRYRNMQGPA